MLPGSLGCDDENDHNDDNENNIDDENDIDNGDHDDDGESLMHHGQNLLRWTQLCELRTSDF